MGAVEDKILTANDANDAKQKNEYKGVIMEIKIDNLESKVIIELYRLNIRTWDDLKKYGIDKFVNTPGFGPQTISNIRDAAEECGFIDLSPDGKKKNIPDYKIVDSCKFCVYRSRVNGNYCVEWSQSIHAYGICGTFKRRINTKKFAVK